MVRVRVRIEEKGEETERAYDTMAYSLCETVLSVVGRIGDWAGVSSTPT
jgi:hypothetical protein